MEGCPGDLIDRPDAECLHTRDGSHGKHCETNVEAENARSTAQPGSSMDLLHYCILQLHELIETYIAGSRSGLSRRSN